MTKDFKVQHDENNSYLATVDSSNSELNGNGGSDSVDTEVIEIADSTEEFVTERGDFDDLDLDLDESYACTQNGTDPFIGQFSSVVGSDSWDEFSDFPLMKAGAEMNLFTL